MQTSRRPIILLLTAAVLMAGCSSDDESAPTTTEPAVTSTTEAQPDESQADEVDEAVLDRVAADICGSISGWSSSIQDAYDATPAAIAEADSIEAARTVVVSWMATMSEHTESLVGELEAIDMEGAEPLEPFVADLAERFGSLNGIVEEHESQAKEITTSAPATFRSEVSGLVDEFNTALADLPTVFEDLNASYPNADLQAALASACELEPIGEGGEADADADATDDGSSEGAPQESPADQE